MTKQDVLKQYFGFPAFRDGQEQLIDAVLNGRDAFGIMPTGGGKSLCYQVPALLMNGVTLVISPLISLMTDQVMALEDAGVSAAFINSSMTNEEFRQTYSKARAGEYKIIYIAPERLMGEGFVSLAQGLEISLVAVDEAHCVSQWGQGNFALRGQAPKRGVLFAKRTPLFGISPRKEKKIPLRSIPLAGLRRKIRRGTT